MFFLLPINVVIEPFSVIHGIFQYKISLRGFRKILPWKSGKFMKDISYISSSDFIKEAVIAGKFYKIYA